MAGAMGTSGGVRVTGGRDDTCPDGCQPVVDDVYAKCDCADEWETWKPGFKTLVEAVGCAGASSTAPMLFVGIAAVLGHFLN
eukprot:COSAG03_NODE_1625_length_3752_cov_136.402233_3_plen_82_part_00